MTDKEVMQMALDALESVYGRGMKCEAAIKTLRAVLTQPEPKEDGYCQACEENHCTAKTGCVAISNPPQKKWESQIERKYSPDGVLLSEKIKYTPDGEWQDLKQQPVAWFTEDHREDKSATTYSKKMAERWKEKGWPVTSLYTTPPQREWQGLTEEEIEQIVDQHWEDLLMFI